MTVTITRTQRRFVLPEADLPTHYVNIAADLPEPLPPPLHPGTRAADRPRDARAALPDGAHPAGGQRGPAHRDPRGGSRGVPDLPAHAAPSGHGAREGARHAGADLLQERGRLAGGSHKPNTAIAQAFYNRAEGITRLVTETGAGQWGSALAFAGSLFGLETKVFMVKISYEQKPYRRSFIESFGATVVPSPSTETNAGRAVLAEDPDSTGSLGIAISEAIEEAAGREDTKYSLGSVPQPRLLHQTVIGQEAMLQMEMAGEMPDVVFGCAGGDRTSPASRSRSCGTSCRADQARGSCGGAGVVPEPDPGQVSLRLRRYAARRRC